MRVVALICTMFLCPSLIWADIFVDAQVDIVVDDNVSYGNHDKDVLGDTALVFNGLVGKPMPLADGILSSSLAIEHTAYQTYDTLNHTWLTGGLTFKDKLALGDVPWYTFGVQVGYKYSADDLRDATFASWHASLGQHITDDLTLSLHYNYELENAAHEVFDSKRSIVSIHGDYLATEDLMLLASYTYMVADVAANMLPNGHIIADVNGVYVTDPAFGPGRASYRLRDEPIAIVSVGGNYYLDEHTAIEAVYEHTQGARIKTIWSHYSGSAYSLSYIMSY